MQNKNLWKPSKFVYRNGKLKSSLEVNEVSVSSRIIVNYIAKFYDENLKEHVKGKLLDLGCGKVPLYEAYKNLISENICVDWSNTLHKNQYLDFEVDLNKNLPFDNNEFDTVILSDVLEHIRYPQKLLKEINRILKKDGKLLLNVPFYYQVHEEPFDFYRYTQYALKMLAEESNFRVVKVKIEGGILAVIGDLSGKIFSLVPYIGKFFVSAINFFIIKFAETKTGVSISEKSKNKFPLAIFMIVQKKK